VDQRIAEHRLTPHMILDQQRIQTAEEADVLPAAPRHPFQIDPGQVVGLEIGKDLVVGPLLRDIVPRGLVDHGEASHHLEDGRCRHSGRPVGNRSLRWQVFSIRIG